MGKIKLGAAGGIFFGVLCLMLSNYLSIQIPSSLFSRLRTVENQLSQKITKFFDDHVTYARQLVTNKDLVADFDLLAKGSAAPMVQKRIGTLPATIKDIVLLSDEGKPVFSLKGATCDASIPSLQQLAHEVPTLLDVRIGMYDLIPSTTIALLPIGFPIAHQNHYVGTLVFILDDQQITHMVTPAAKQLTSNAQAMIGRVKDGKALLLFSSSPDKSALHDSYLLETKIPLARACQGQIQTTAETFENRWLVSATGYLQELSWGIAIQDDETNTHRGLIALRMLGFILLAIGCLLAVWLVYVARAMGVRFLLTHIKMVILLTLGIGLMGALVVTHIELSKRKSATLDMLALKKSQARTQAQNIALRLSERANQLTKGSVPSYEDIEQVVKTLGRDRLKDLIIFDRQGITVFHENKEFVQDKISAIEIEEQYGATIVAQSFKKAEQGNSGSFDFVNDAKEKWFLVYEVVPKLGWTVALFTSERSLQEPTEILQAYDTQSIVCLLIALVLFLAILSKLYDPRPYVLYLFSAFYTVLLICGIGLLIARNYYFTHYIRNQQAITSELAVSQLKTDLEIKTGKPYVQIPTHVTMQFLDVHDPTRVVFSALVEQRIDRVRYPDVKLGFGFTNASRPITVTKIREYKRGTQEIAQFEVEGTVYQAGAIYSDMFSKMPFDMESISFRMEPVKQKYSIMLVPDFEKYEHMNPDDKPGLDRTFELKDYELVTAYFVYKFEADDPSRPLLTYAVFAQRNLLSVALEYFIPLFVILLTIFIMSMMSVHIRPTKQVNIIGVISVLFFSLILVHQNFRASFVVEGLTLLEAIILMVYASLCYGYFDALYLINRAHLHTPKMLLYWPAVATYLFAVAAIYL